MNAIVIIHPPQLSPEMAAAEAAFRWMECIPYLAQTKTEPVVERDGLSLFQGDCLHILAMQPDASIDALVTDPPAGIGFMGKDWDDLSTWPIRRDGDAARETKPGKRKSGPDLDYDYGPRGRAGFIAFLRDVARECFRVMKPGAHGLVWALPRTSHWTATALEEAGFEIRDCINHVFGSGFPKSLNVSKAIDKAAGATREVVGTRVLTGNAALSTAEKGGTYGVQVGSAPAKEIQVTAPATDAAKQWDGWGTALKPAVEHWWLVRKPIEGTVAESVQEHGTGAINIGATRVPSATPITINRFVDGAKPFGGGAGHEFESVQSSGRWPANLVLSHAPDCRRIGEKKVKNTAGDLHGAEPSDPTTNIYGHRMRREWRKHGDADGMETIDVFECVEGCPVAELDSQSGELTSRARAQGVRSGMGFNGATGDGGPALAADSGGASRFFHRFEWDQETLDTELEVLRFIYSAKPSTSERNTGCEDLPDVEWWSEAANHARPDRVNTSSGKPRASKPSKNFHPTVKGQHLMRHLVRLITPPRGTVLDPFAGSGSTLVAAHAEGFRCVGIEREGDYIGIARKRIEHATTQRSLFAVGDG